ncbi:unnamed protein product [Tilletia controversa]|nr:hypothetical protein CF336_g4588 [Tilletia laevis]KAE8197402.1 hypothetical protein CF328_g3855 [Tilletia controversa]KAE8260207.1 hypothetical protein A4X03_0g3885 [Tilletia caries]KAE8201113.1 hypothetical protein CF335_g3808 [Tilletia laevis]CAD6890531.1 unnamed protein product [Tilletia caries]
MVLDTACFTLHVHRRSEADGISDLFDAADILAHHAAVSVQPPSNLSTPPPSSAGIAPLYSHHRALASPVYDVLLTDPRFGDAQLASCSAPSSAERTKTISLHNPETSVVFAKQGGTLAAFNQGEWRIEWEGDLLLRWKREGSGIGKASYQASVLRSPDPPISVGAYHPPSKKTPAIIQIYDHNFHRLEITDPRGLEIVMVQTAMILVDAEFDEDHKAPGSNPFLSTLVPRPPLDSFRSGASGSSSGAVLAHGQGGPAPGMQPSPSSTSLGTVAANEILVTPHGQINSYVSAALNLLQSESTGGHGCSLIELKATPGRPDAAQKAVAVAAAVKAGWHKRGSAEQELYQYVRTDDDQGQGKGTSAGTTQEDSSRRRIQLNGPPSSSVVTAPLATDPYASYQPPSTLSIILSKDRLPELEPKARPTSSGSAGFSPSSPPGRPIALNSNPGRGADSTGNNQPRLPPKTMSIRRNGRWVPEPVPAHPAGDTRLLSGGVVAAPLPGASAEESGSTAAGTAGKQHHGRRLLNKLGFGGGSGGGS